MFEEYRPKGLYATHLKTWAENAPWLLWQVIGTGVFVWLTGDWWGLVFGMLPDIADGAWIAVNKLRGVDVWMSGEMIGHPWRAVSTTLTRNQNILSEVALLAVLALTVAV